MQPVPAPADERQFSLSMGNPQPSKTQCPLPVIVNKVTGQANASVVLKEPSNTHNWCATSVWLANAKNGWVYPSSPSRGITWVALHACHYNQCPFSFVRCLTHCNQASDAHKTFSVADGEQIVLTTPTGVLTYRVCGVGTSPKYSNDALQVPTCTTPIDLVVGDCEYEQGDTSRYNIVIAATLVGSVKR